MTAIHRDLLLYKLQTGWIPVFTHKNVT